MSFRTRARLILLVLLTFVTTTAEADPRSTAAPGDLEGEIRSILDEYVEAWLATYPTRATGAGAYAHDRELEDFSPAAIRRWLETNRRVVDRLEDPSLDLEALPAPLRRDAVAAAREARGEIFRFTTLDAPSTRPLFWTGPLANAAVFFLVRDDRPLADRLDRLGDRARHIPRYCRQARAALEKADGSRVVREHAEMAARQARATATFYRDGLPRTLFGLMSGKMREILGARLEPRGERAAVALDDLADAFDALAKRATGSPRLGESYAASFRMGTGVETPVAEVLAAAEADLETRRAETAVFCRSTWDLVVEGSEEEGESPEPPEEDREVVRRCFARVAADHAESVEAFVEEYRRLTRDARSFVREHRIMDVPEGLHVRVDRSPDFFVGQAVGGVYPAGPFAPDAPTLLYVPTPPADASEEVVAAFFRDFNHHFDVMITPHETIPGHAAQMAVAARLDSPVPSLFADGVYVEGWGTYSERLMLDAGWGTPLARVAHLKKQLENIARTIVDIRVHTTEISRDEVIRFVREEALQDDRFAANMWARAITTSPQLTTYWLGDRQIRDLHADYRAAKGESYELGAFVDAMVSLGPVPVEEYRRHLLDEPNGSGRPVS